MTESKDPQTKPIDSLDFLQWTEPSLIPPHRHLYTDEQLSQLNRISINSLNDRTFGHLKSNHPFTANKLQSQYRSNAMILSHSSHPKATPISYCLFSHPNDPYPKANCCHAKWYCPRCNYLQSLSTSQTYSHLFDHNPNLHFHHITLGYHRTNKPIKPSLCSDFILKQRKMLCRLVSKHSLGALATIDLSIHRISPKLILNPHIHCILATSEPTVPPLLLKRFHKHFKIVVKPIEDSFHFSNCISYTKKTIDLSTQYDLEFLAGKNIYDLNRHLRQAINLIDTLLPFKTPRSNASGIFHFNVGKPPKHSIQKPVIRLVPSRKP